jgi:glycosyltransferase involved in cell wall biosynthesis
VKGATLVVPLGIDADAAGRAVQEQLGDGALEVVSLPELARRGFGSLRRARYSKVAIVGAPPAMEIGYGLALLAAVAAGPRMVVEIDLASGVVRAQALARFTARATPTAVAQLAASAVAIGLQGVIARRVSAKKLPRGKSGSLERVLYLRPTVGTTVPVGGAITHTHEVIRALRQEGVDVEAITTDLAIARTAANDPDPPCEWTLVLPGRLLKAVPASTALAEDIALVRAGSATEVDVIYQRHTRFSLCGAVLARRTGQPLFLEYNGSERFVGRYWNPTPFQRRLAACEAAALAAATRIFVVSQVDRDDLIERGVQASRIVLNPNGVDVERFAQGGGDAVRKTWGIEGPQFVVGFLGTFGPWHGAPLLARAFGDLARSLPTARLLLVGHGPEVAATKSELTERGVADRAIFAGRVTPTEVPAYLDACDVLASPHVPLPDGVEFFGSPTKLYEYMAAGKAIVASDLGQIGDVLTQGETALLVRPGDSEELAAALQRVAEDSSLRADLGRNARAAAEGHTWRANARRVIDTYGALESESGPG